MELDSNKIRRSYTLYPGIQAYFVATKSIVIKPTAYYDGNELFHISINEYEPIQYQSTDKNAHFETIVCDFKENGDTWQCACGHLNPRGATKCELCSRVPNQLFEKKIEYIKDLKEIGNKIQECESAADVLECIQTYSITNNYVNMVVIPKIREYINEEVSKGNQKNQLIENIQNWLWSGTPSTITYGLNLPVT